jgi:hypothetical protein
MILTIAERKTFDVNNREHLNEFKFFIENERWTDGCPFMLEWPHTSIPDMIKDKIVRKMLQC